MRGSLRLLLVAVILGVGLAEEEEDGPAFVKAIMGEDRKLTCKGAEEESTLTWSVTSDNAENDTKTVAAGEKYEIEGNSLVVKNVQEEDLGVYRCYEEDEEVAAYHLDISVRVKKFPPSFSIDEGSSTDPIMRVKDPLAAVWPFCGIVVEVILLCVIIFFCEKKKTGSEKEDYDEGSNGNNIGSSRQRK